MKNRTVFPHIQVNPAVRFGKPVIEGTRVPVDLVVGKLAGGMTVDELVGEFVILPECRFLRLLSMQHMLYLKNLWWLHECSN